MPELPKLTFVLGGAASGKSAFAEALIFATEAPRVYVATAQVFDEEMKGKVDEHLKERGPDWRTIEAPFDPAEALSTVAENEVVLLDCATMWLSNQLIDETSDLEAATVSLFEGLQSCAGRVVVVSNEVGMGIVPDNKLARDFRNKQGKLNQKLAALADLSVFVVAGLPVVLKGQLP